MKFKYFWCLFFFLFYATKGVAQSFQIHNPFPHSTPLQLFSYPLQGTKKAYLLTTETGKSIPCAYDRKQKCLYFCFEAPPKITSFSITPAKEEVLPQMLWNENITSETYPVKIGNKRIKRPSATLENGLFRLKIVSDQDVRSKVEIQALSSPYQLTLIPLGMAQGCIEKEQIAEKLNEEIAQGITTNPEIFTIYSGTATHIQIHSPNPFQRLIQVKCLSLGIKNNGKTLNLFSRSDYEILLTWKSPLLQIRSFRTQKKAYYNHNGVDLNEIFLDAFPIQIESDQDPSSKEFNVQGSQYERFLFEQIFRLRTPSGQTVFFQPDFPKLAIRDPCGAVLSDRLMCVISHSWHQGWKPVEQPAREYNDTLTLVCKSDLFLYHLQEWKDFLTYTRWFEIVAPKMEEK